MPCRLWVKLFCSPTSSRTTGGTNCRLEHSLCSTFLLRKTNRLLGWSENWAPAHPLCDVGWLSKVQNVKLILDKIGVPNPMGPGNWRQGRKTCCPTKDCTFIFHPPSTLITVDWVPNAAVTGSSCLLRCARQLDITCVQKRPTAYFHLKVAMKLPTIPHLPLHPNQACNRPPTRLPGSRNVRWNPQAWKQIGQHQQINTPCSQCSLFVSLKSLKLQLYLFLEEWMFLILVTSRLEP